MREKSTAIDWEIAFASVVLPTPGMSMSKTCPGEQRDQAQVHHLVFAHHNPSERLPQPTVHLPYPYETPHPTQTLLHDPFVPGNKNRSSNGRASAPRTAIIDLVPEKPEHEAHYSPAGEPRQPNAPRDLRLMRRALEEAREAARKGEVPVGAVVARGDEIFATAHNERETAGDPTAHAELLALRRAAERVGGWRLSGCTLYATLEPCPMCAGALHAARIGRLVYAAPDPKAGAAGTLYDIPSDKRLNHTFSTDRGVLQADSVALLRAFFKKRRRGP